MKTKRNLLKRLTTLGAAALLSVGLLASCGDSDSSSKKDSSGGSSSAKEINVYAAASLTESLNKLAEQYKTEHSDVKINFNFDSSGTLQKQIEAGGECDLFISAAQKQMTALIDGSYVDSAAKKDILENKVVLIVPADSTAKITSFDDCATDQVSLIALGNSDVPVGQYAEKLFTAMGIWDAVSAKATLGTNVKEVLSYVSEAAVDCGVVYYTDYVTAKDKVKVAAEAPEGKVDPAVYPAAVLKAAANADAAEEFLTYLQSDAGDTVFTENGFTVME